MHSNRCLLSLSLLVAVVLTGCQSVSNSVNAHFTQAPVVRTVEADRDRTFHAALAALKAMNYTVNRSRAREGLIEATGRIYADSNLRSAQQYTLHIEIEATADGRADVKVEARELVEEQRAGGSMMRSERPIPQGTPHNRFFDELLRRL